MQHWNLVGFSGQRSSCRGFTVLELLIVVLMIGVLANSAISATVATLKSVDKNTARVQVVQDIRRAQATSVTEGCRGILAVALGGTHYTYGCDYLPYDTNPIPVADVVFFTTYLPSNITISTSDVIIFNSRGQLIDANYNLVTRTVTLTAQTGGAGDFATGTIRATGFFSYD